MAYFADGPDFSVLDQWLAFGTSGYRGSRY